jgi:hypothetical protein
MAHLILILAGSTNVVYAQAGARQVPDGGLIV